MPFGVAGEEVVHLGAPDVALFQIPDGAKAVLRDLIKACLSAIIRATYYLRGREDAFSGRLKFRPQQLLEMLEMLRGRKNSPARLRRKLGESRSLFFGSTSLQAAARALAAAGT
jgi:hypothetical protein